MTRGKSMAVLLPPALSALVPEALRRLRLARTPELPAPVRDLLPGLFRMLGALPGARSLGTQAAVNYYGYATTPRPRELTLAVDYPTWRTLTDRRWTGRHLPPADPEIQERWPAAADVVGLFRREGAMTPSDDTSAMFMFFAQWFTDSFLRTDPTDPRRNTSNHEIDLCQIYGLSEDATRKLRGTRGRLRSQHIDGREFPEFLLERDGEGGWRVRPDFVGLHDERFLFDQLLAGTTDEHKAAFFAVGLPHGNSTIGQTMMNAVFFREHNRIADTLAATYPQWDDDRVFETTRNTMIVLTLKLVIEQYIRHIAPFDLPLEVVPRLAEIERWNRPNWCAVEFDLLYRWHQLTPDTVRIGNEDVPVWELVNNNPLVLAEGVESLMAACSAQRAGKIGLRNTPAFLVDRAGTGDQPSVEERTVALMRTARLASYNDYREAFGLRRFTRFEELTGDEDLVRRLQKLYDRVDDVEWYVGIFAEEYASYWMMGELITTMVAYDAFTQALTNPLLAANVFHESTFSRVGMEVIEGTASLEDIVRRNAAEGDEVRVAFSC
ncbi:MAG TPA: peroxidase family protein [Actinomycetospora sp.]|uniref:peroxidase family protein n=1 Tax=Actinomycetospora sp. TaxID=1872135 RepID=UPI002F403506